jgi:hypothetical protein
MRLETTFGKRSVIRVSVPVERIVREDRINRARFCFDTLAVMAKPSAVTGATLGALAVLHTAWGLGSSFPFRDRSELADAVIGRSTVPPARACFTVASLLAVGTALVLHPVPMPKWFRNWALATTATVFLLRSAAGFCAKTSLLSRDSDSDRFRHLDRQLYSPLCLLLAIGTLGARD